MNDLGTIKCEFYGFGIRYLVEFDRVFKIFGIGIQITRNILPHHHLFCIQDIGKDGSGKIRSFPSQCGAELSGAANKSLGDHHLAFLQFRNGNGMDAIIGGFPVDFCSPVCMVGHDQFPCIEPGVGVSLFSQVSTYDPG